MPTPTLSSLLLALLSDDPLDRETRRLIARTLCRLLREQQYLELRYGPTTDTRSGTIG